MRRGTTPTLTFTIPFEASTITKLSIAFAQKGKVIFEKTLDDVSRIDKTISLPLTEEDTLKFDASYALEMQIRCGIGSERLASNIIKTDVERILKGDAL